MKKSLVIGLSGIALLALAADYPCREYEAPYLQDFEVTETVTRRKLTVSEIGNLIDQLPNVKRVERVLIPRFFSVDDLAYPQNKYHYQIPRKDWDKLQQFCVEELAKGPDNGAPSVRDHWQSIVDGKPPFGLTLQDK